MRRMLVAGLTSMAAFAASPAAAQTHSELQERYCTSDAFRLCSSEIPDETRIIACMTRQRHLLSADCRAVFDDPPAAQSARAAPAPVSRPKPGKPLQLQAN